MRYEPYSLIEAHQAALRADRERDDLAAHVHPFRVSPLAALLRRVGVWFGSHSVTVPRVTSTSESVTPAANGAGTPGSTD